MSLLRLENWALRAILIGNLAPGVEFDWVIPNNLRKYLLGASFTLTTDATAANRRPYMLISTNSAAYHVTRVSPYLQAASLARTYYWSLDAVDTNLLLAADVYTIRIPPGMFLDTQHGLHIFVQDHQAGDVISALSLFFLESAQTDTPD